MKARGAFFNDLFKAPLWLALKTLYRLRVEGARNCPKRGGLVVVANHTSFFDPVLLGCALPRPLVYTPRRTLRKSAAYRAFVALLDLEHVERDGRDLAATRRMIARLEQGDALALFPEQTRSPDGRMSPFTPGFVLLAQHAKVPVLPVAIHGGFEAWPRGRKRPYWTGRIGVRVGEPLDLSALDRREAVARVEQAMATLGAKKREAPATASSA